MDRTEVEIPESMHIENQPSTNPGITDTTPDPRKDAMAAIYASRQAQIEAENDQAKEFFGVADNEQPADVLADPAPKPTDAPPAKAAEAAAPSAEAAPAAAQPPLADPNPGAAQGKKYQLAVNGRMIEMGEDDVVRAAQKVLGADEAFREAARLRQEAQNMRNQPPIQSQPAQQPPMQQHQQPQGGFDPMQLIDDNTADDLVRRINYGSEQEQRSAIRDLGATIAIGLGRANNGPTPDQIVEVATQRALGQISFQNNLQAIGKEYEDVFADRGLTLVAADTLGTLRTQYAAQGVQKPDFEMWREACQKTRERYLAPSTPSTETPNNSPSVQAAQPAVTGEKFERKRAAPQPPAAATMVATETSKPKGYDPSAIVQRMRQQRGQASY